MTLQVGATADIGGPCDGVDDRRDEHQVQLGLSSSRTTPEDINPQHFVIDTAEFHPRSYMQIHIEGLGSYRALIDSGAQVCCVKQALVEHLQLPVHRQIRVSGMNGCAEVTNVVQVHVRPVVDETTGLKNIAPVAELAEDFIITPNDFGSIADGERLQRNGDPDHSKRKCPTRAGNLYSRGGSRPY